MILCCGEALIDMLPSETSSGQTVLTPTSGGSVFNTAIALARLDAPTKFFSGLSNDLFGQQLMQTLHASNVDTTHVVLSERPTTLAFVQLTDGQATYTFYDENSAGRMLQSNDIPNLPPDVKTLYFGGISLASEPCGDTYLELAQRYSSDCSVMVDPNIRPAFIKNEGRFRDRISQMFSLADIVKVSDDDLNWLIPTSQPVEVKAAQILVHGPKLLVLTRGSRGATGFTSNGAMIDVPAVPANVVDTVGAGDTFNAGFLAKMEELNVLKKPSLGNLKESQIADAMEYGARVSAVTVGRVGSNPPWKRELF